MNVWCMTCGRYIPEGDIPAHTRHDIWYDRDRAFIEMARKARRTGKAER